MFKLKIGDQVLVTSGREKGKKGKIEKVYPKGDKVLVGEVNIYKRHRKVSKRQSAGIYEFARPLPVANVALICPKCGKSTRVGFRAEGKIKNRICAKCKSKIS